MSKLKFSFSVLILAAGASVAIWFWSGQESAENARADVGVDAPAAIEETPRIATAIAGGGADRPIDNTSSERKSDEAIAANTAGAQRELLSSEREIVSEFNDKYMDALSFGSPKQREWALKHGFPSEEHVIAAAGMTTDQLRTRAESDDSVYESLYFDRLLDESIRQLVLVTNGATLRDDYLTTPEGFELLSTLRRQSEEVLKDRDSAFAGYLLFRYNDRFSNNSYAALAALHLVGVRGDRRIDKAVRPYADQNGIPPEAIEILAEYSTMVQAAGGNYPEPIPVD